jgi:hypothetical protein
MVVVHGKPELLEVVPALRAPRRIPGHLHCGEKQGDQNRDDRDDDQQLDQGKTRRTIVARHGSVPPKKKMNGRNAQMSSKEGVPERARRSGTRRAHCTAAPFLFSNETRVNSLDPVMGWASTTCEKFQMTIQ